MTKLVLTIDWRTVIHGWPGGQIYLLDLEHHSVLDHFIGSLDLQGPMEPGGWSGFRGVFCQGQRAFIADVNSIRSFDLSNDRIKFERGWSTQRLYDIHDTWLESDGSWWLTATTSDEAVRVSPHPDLPLINFIEAIDIKGILLGAGKAGSGRKYDTYHVNSVVTRDGCLWCLANDGGWIVCRPAPGAAPTVHPCRMCGGHSIRVTPTGDLIVLDTLQEEIVVLAPDGKEPLRRISTQSARLAEKVDPNTGNKAQSGWLRGCHVIDNTFLVAGTSPAQLFVVNYRTGKVEDYWWIDHDDVRASTFGIAVVQEG